MKGYIVHLEEETKSNNDYRRVLYTTQGMQLVLMSLAPGIEIGEEVHDLDQFIRVDEGSATAILDGERHVLLDGDAVIIPRGVRHNIINEGGTDVKLYSLYSPPEHKDKLVQATKNDEREEHWDGAVSV